MENQSEQLSSKSLQSYQQLPYIIRKAKAWKMKQPQYMLSMNLQHIGNRFPLSRLSPQVDGHYSVKLKDCISSEEFAEFLESINTILLKYWPPRSIIILSYLLVIFTCGLSLLLPMLCLNQADQYVQWKLDEYNIRWEKVGLRVGWKKSQLVMFIVEADESI